MAAVHLLMAMVLLVIMLSAYALVAHAFVSDERRAEEDKHLLLPRDGLQQASATTDKHLLLLHGPLENKQRSQFRLKSVPPVIKGSGIGAYGGCIYSDRMQLIYVKTAKSAGSTTLLGWLRPSLCPAVSSRNQFRGWGSSNSTFSKKCAEDVLYPPPGTDSSPCESIPLWKWEQYFVFTTVRNPYTRMRSSYTYCNSGLDWSTFCKDPKLTGKCGSHAKKTSKLTEHVYNSHYQFPIHWAYHGWWGWHVDYIIKTEDMPAGIAEVAQLVNAAADERGEALRLMTSAVDVNVRPTNRSRRETCRFYTGAFSGCAHALERSQDPFFLGYQHWC